jgi:hypothetical protein
MNLARLAAALLALPALASAAAVSGPREPLPIGEVVNLSRSGASAEQVIQRIRDSATTYALRGSDFVKLRAAGVPDPALDYLQQSFVDHLDLLTRYWVLGGNLGGCSFCYPQPVDVDAMLSGYANVSATPPARFVLYKPAGTPNWVPYPPSSFNGPRLSVDQIVELASGGMPAADLVQRIRSAQLTHVIGIGGHTAVRTHPLAGLGGAELARLKGQGVPDAALDALQGQFLAAFIETERMRYKLWGKGSKR